MIQGLMLKKNMDLKFFLNIKADIKITHDKVSYIKSIKYI